MTVNRSSTRRWFLQSAGMGLAASACQTRFGLAAQNGRRIPIRGVIPAALTPFDADLQIAWREFQRHVEALAAVPGVTAIMINGAAGQDSALSRDERRSLVAQATEAVGHRVPILAALRETKQVQLEQLAQDAATAHADAVLIMPPPAKEDLELERAANRFRRVFDATDLPVAFYQTGYSTDTLTELARFPQVFAIKEGNGSPAIFEQNMRSVRAIGREVAIWSTHSRWLLADLAVGADGILSGMGSIAADLHVALAEAVWRSDLDAARRINDRLFPLTQVFYRPGFDAHTRMKYALTRLGRWQSAAVRPPLTPLDASERALIDRALHDIFKCSY